MALLYEFSSYNKSVTLIPNYNISFPVIINIKESRERNIAIVNSIERSQPFLRKVRVIMCIFRAAPIFYIISNYLLLDKYCYLADLTPQVKEISRSACLIHV